MIWVWFLGRKFGSSHSRALAIGCLMCAKSIFSIRSRFESIPDHSSLIGFPFAPQCHHVFETKNEPPNMFAIDFCTPWPLIDASFIHILNFRISYSVPRVRRLQRELKFESSTPLIFPLVPTFFFDLLARTLRSFICYYGACRPRSVPTLSVCSVRAFHFFYSSPDRCWRHAIVSPHAVPMSVSDSVYCDPICVSCWWKMKSGFGLIKIEEKNQ